MKKLTLTIALLLTVALLIPGAATAQNKVAQCENIKAVVDMKSGNDWKNSVATLGLTESGGGWVIQEPTQRSGETIDALVGMELRFTFTDGTHPINVTATKGGGEAIAIEQNQPHIVRVTANKKTQNAASFKFEITGAKNPAAKINGCTGGGVSIVVE